MKYYGRMVWRNVFGLYASTREKHCFDCDIKGSSYTRVALYASIYGTVENLLLNCFFTPGIVRKWPHGTLQIDLLSLGQ